MQQSLFDLARRNNGVGIDAILEKVVILNLLEPGFVEIRLRHEFVVLTVNGEACVTLLGPIDISVSHLAARATGYPYWHRL
jgi:hypothetical protein